MELTTAKALSWICGERLRKTMGKLQPGKSINQSRFK